MAIKVKELSLLYPVASRKRKKNSSEKMGGVFVTEGKHSYLRALNKISFELEDGGAIAIIGGNGAGKSTLLQVLAGIIPASSGTIKADGDIRTFFSSTLVNGRKATGRDNVELFAALYNLNREQTCKLIEDVLNFSELGEYFDEPVRTYSAGMRARLGFSTATSLDADILLVDEGLGTGDQYFIDKAEKRVQDFVAQSGSLVLASHSLGILRTYCKTAIWLDHGNVMKSGELEEVIAAYKESAN